MSEVCAISLTFSLNLRLTNPKHIFIQNSFSGLNFMNSLKSMGTELYTYHHIIAISTPLNWFGPRLRDTKVAALIEMVWNGSCENPWEELLEQVWMFVFLC
jgi:hypothetical protein